jgi:hypothetical protein
MISRIRMDKTFQGFPGYHHFAPLSSPFPPFFLLSSRSVEEQERPFALGMQFVLLRTLGE